MLSLADRQMLENQILILSMLQRIDRDPPRAGVRAALIASHELITRDDAARIAHLKDGAM